MKTLPVLVLLAAAVGCLLITAQAAAVSETYCEACGEKIAGAYFETGGKFYHPHHFTCDHCQEPIKESYSVYQGKKYHTECFEDEIALRCSVCGEIIAGKYLLDHWGNAYHRWHVDDVTRCDFCGRLVVGSLIDGMAWYRDGRFLCGICSASAVTDLEEAKTLMIEVAKQLAKFGLVIDHKQVNLHLVGRDKLQQFSRNDAHGLRGFTDCEHVRNMFGFSTYRRIDLHILYGMPRVEMISTLAHELTHVYQFLEGQPTMDRALSEGSSNFASYVVLKKIGGEDAEFIIANMMADTDPVYGKGFRRVKRYVEKHGLRAWIELLRCGSFAKASF